MTTWEKITSIFDNEIGYEFSRKEIIDLVLEKFPETNKSSVIPSDYCYNLYNKGIKFDKHIFEHIETGHYKVLGRNVKYSGNIYHLKNKWKAWVNGVIVD